MTVGFYFDMTRCIGCRACQVACKDKNRLEVGTLYREVHSFTVGKFPEVRSYSHTFGCNHCKDAICLKNCPTGAIYKAADGTVIQDQSKCIGCRMCVMSCPYGQPKYFPEKGVSGKCDGCYGLRQDGGEPACVAGCPNRALEFGDATSSVKNTIPGDLPSSDFDEVTSIIRSHHSTGPQSELNR